MWCVFDLREKVLGGSFGKSGQKLVMLQCFFWEKLPLGALCCDEPRQKTLIDAHVGRLANGTDDGSIV